MTGELECVWRGLSLHRRTWYCIGDRWVVEACRPPCGLGENVIPILEQETRVILSSS